MVGTSNTIALAEFIIGPVDNKLGRAVAYTATMQNNPLACRATLINGLYNTATVAQGRAPGQRWQDGRAGYCGINTILPPNSASCTSQTSSGIHSASSKHTGGVQAGLADGSVHFISANIDTGNLSLPPVTSGISPCGVWGALGSKDGGEPTASVSQ